MVLLLPVHMYCNILYFPEEASNECETCWGKQNDKTILNFILLILCLYYYFNFEYIGTESFPCNRKTYYNFKPMWNLILFNKHFLIFLTGFTVYS